MQSLASSIMGFFMSILSIFHQGATPVNTLPSTTPTATTSPQRTPSNVSRGTFGDMGINLPSGEQRFFGAVTQVNGSTLTVQMQMRGRPPGDSTAPPDTQQTSQTITVTLDSTTTYTGGSQSDITTNTRIAGVGKANSDGSITATQVEINPTIPSGFPRRPGNNQ